MRIRFGVLFLALAFHSVEGASHHKKVELPCSQFVKLLTKLRSEIFGAMGPLQNLRWNFPDSVTEEEARHNIHDLLNEWRVAKGRSWKFRMQYELAMSGGSPVLDMDHLKAEEWIPVSKWTDWGPGENFTSTKIIPSHRDIISVWRTVIPRMIPLWSARSVEKGLREFVESGLSVDALVGVPRLIRDLDLSIAPPPANDSFWAWNPDQILLHSESVGANFFSALPSQFPAIVQVSPERLIIQRGLELTPEQLSQGVMELEESDPQRLFRLATFYPVVIPYLSEKFLSQLESRELSPQDGSTTRTPVNIYSFMSPDQMANLSKEAVTKIIAKALWLEFDAQRLQHFFQTHRKWLSKPTMQAIEEQIRARPSVSRVRSLPSDRLNYLFRSDIRWLTSDQILDNLSNPNPELWLGPELRRQITPEQQRGLMAKIGSDGVMRISAGNFKPSVETLGTVVKSIIDSRFESKALLRSTEEPRTDLGRVFRFYMRVLNDGAVGEKYVPPVMLKKAALFIYHFYYWIALQRKNLNSDPNLWSDLLYDYLLARRTSFEDRAAEVKALSALIEAYPEIKIPLNAVTLETLWKLWSWAED